MIRNRNRVYNIFSVAAERVSLPVCGRLMPV